MKTFLTIGFQFILLSALISCTPNLKEIEKVTRNEVLPMEISTETEIIYSTLGEIKVKVVAPVMERYVGENPYLEMTKGVDLTFFDDTLGVKSNLKSDYAITKDSENIYIAEKNVVLTNIQGDTLRTESLTWDANNEIIFSEDLVKITTPNQIIMGRGFESNQEFTKYSMKKITATINIKQNGKGF